MTLLNLFTQKIVVSRLTAIPGTDKTKFATITAEYVSIHRLADEKAVMIGEAIGKTFRLYCEEDADIEKGDELKDSTTGDEYRVTGITKPAVLGNFVHQEAIIILIK